MGTSKYTPQNQLDPTCAQCFGSEGSDLGVRGGSLVLREVVATPKVPLTGDGDPKKYSLICITPYLCSLHWEQAGSKGVSWEQGEQDGGELGQWSELPSPTWGMRPASGGLGPIWGPRPATGGFGPIQDPRPVSGGLRPWEALGLRSPWKALGGFGPWEASRGLGPWEASGGLGRPQEALCLRRNWKTLGGLRKP